MKRKDSQMAMGAADFPLPKLLLTHLLCSTALFCLFSSLGFAATPRLHTEEVKVLREIGRKLGKKDWDFEKDPCNGEGNWKVLTGWKGSQSSVTCDCSFNNNSSCHIVSIALKAQNISASLPPDFSKLRHLRILDLSRNYITGSIPPEWSTMRLTELSLMGCRLSGPFPKVLTNIITLTNLSIEGNLFSGPIPPETGKLINLQKFVVASNDFTGELPPELGKLINLTDIREESIFQSSRRLF